jgi:hypothetical protein
MYTFDSYYLLGDRSFQAYQEQFGDTYLLNKGIHIMEDGFFIQRRVLGHIAAKYRKMILSFETGKLHVKKKTY